MTAKTMKTVVIGSTLGPESDAIVAAGLAFARELGARAEIVHAYTPITSTFVSFEVGQAPVQWLEDERRALLEALEAQAARAEGGAVATHLAEGAPHRILVDRARELDALLLVVGAAVPGPLHWPFGATADRVVRQAHCPVLIVRPGGSIPPRSVVAAVDLSPVSADSLRCGLELLGALDERPTIELLFVLDPFESAGLRQFSREQIHHLAESELHRFANAASGETGIGLQRKVRVGSPSREILEEVANRRPDLVLIGTHGRGGIERLLLGSVATRVARACPASLLVVPPRALEAIEGERLEAAEVGPDWSHVSDEVAIASAV